jgi:hypothetical protein
MWQWLNPLSNLRESHITAILFNSNLRQRQWYRRGTDVAQLSIIFRSQLAKSYKYTI